MKIEVFKLNWIEQRNLEFDVHEVHSGKKKVTTEDHCRQALGKVDVGYMDTPDRDSIFDSLSTTIA